MDASAKGCRDRLRDTLHASNEARVRRDGAQTPEEWHFWDETVRGCAWQIVQLRLKLFELGGDMES